MILGILGTCEKCNDIDYILKIVDSFSNPEISMLLCENCNSAFINLMAKCKDYDLQLEFDFFLNK